MAKKTSPEVVAECIRLRREERLSLSAIANRAKISQATASVLLRDFPLSEAEIRAAKVAGAHKTLAMRTQKDRGKYIDLVPVSSGSRGGTTAHKGEIAMLKCSIRAAELGMIISRPTIECRYDCVLDVGDKLARVQVKYCDSRIICGSITLNLTRRGKPYHKHEVDIVLGYIPMVDRIVWITPEHFDGKRTLAMRISVANNGHQNSVRMIEDFLW